jgi:hypothetical protein
MVIVAPIAVSAQGGWDMQVHVADIRRSDFVRSVPYMFVRLRVNWVVYGIVVGVLFSIWLSILVVNEETNFRWYAFAAIGAVVGGRDTSHGMIRMEVRSTHGDNDGLVSRVLREPAERSVVFRRLRPASSVGGIQPARKRGPAPVRSFHWLAAMPPAQ